MEAPANYAYRDFENSARLRDHLTAARLSTPIDAIIEGRFIAVHLEDCQCDGVVYDKRDDAVNHVSRNPNQYMYIQLTLDLPWSHIVCDSLLWYWRGVYAQGYRPAGSHEGADLILPIRNEAL